MTAPVDMTELKDLIEKQNKTFEEMQGRLDKVEKSGEDFLDKTAIGALNDELDKVTKQIDEMNLKLNRPGNKGGEELSEDAIQHKEQFNKFLRKGQADEDLAELQHKAMSIGTDADGGYAVPEELDRSIGELALDLSPMRQISNVVQVSTEGWKKLFNVGGTASGWVGETAARPETGTSQLTPVTPPMGEIYANPATTQRALDDVFFNVEAFIADEVAKEFAKQEGDAFLNGDGTNKPKGLLTYTTAATADNVRAFGTMEHIATGQAAALPTTAGATEDWLIDIISKLNAKYKQNARWLMNSAFVATIRKLRDADGRSLWQPSTVAGDPSTLLGFAVTQDEYMPGVAADSLPVAFGNFSEAYSVLDRIGTRVLRDAYTNKPYVHFYTTKRVGGGLINSEAVKLGKVATA